MDLLYIIGGHSPWLDNELRYSLRSAERHYPVGRVIIAGDRPEWLKEIGHIPCDDPYPWKVQNVLHKLQAATESTMLSDRFVLMNDDFIFLRDLPEELPVYTRGQLATLAVINNAYKDTVMATINLLRKEGVRDPLNYGVHFPLMMKTDRVRAMLAEHGGSGRSYMFRSVYGNLEKLKAIDGAQPKVRARWKEPSAHTSFLSIDDTVATDKLFQRWIMRRFPEKSRWEA